MGTRGCYGFRKNGMDKLTYNHFDSYPDCLGHTMVKFCKATSISELNEIFDKLILAQPFHGFPVGEFTQDDWFHWVDDHHSKGVGWVYENISPFD